MSSSPHLPQDLLNTIVDELAYDLGTLRACALTSSALCSQAQKHIFYNVYLDVRVGSELQHLLLCQWFQSNPKLSVLVRCLTLRLHYCDWRTQFSDACSSDIQRTFNRVHTIILTPPRNGRPVPWKHMSGEIPSGVLALINWPTVEYFKVRSQRDFPISILGSCRHLKGLEIFDSSPSVVHPKPYHYSTRPVLTASLPPPTATTLDPTRPLGHLTSLNVDLYQLPILKILNNLDSSLLTSNLRFMTINDDPFDDGVELGRTLDEAAPSLSELHYLDFNLQRRASMLVNCFHHARSLRSLTLEAFVEEISDMIVPLTNVMHSISTPRCDRAFQIRIRCAERITNNFAAFDKEWKDLNARLAYMLDVSILRRVEMTIWRPQDDENVLGVIGRLLPVLDSRGWLHTHSSFPYIDT